MFNDQSVEEYNIFFRRPPLSKKTETIVNFNNLHTKQAVFIKNVVFFLSSCLFENQNVPYSLNRHANTLVGTVNVILCTI